MIRYITPEFVADERRVRALQADLGHTYYWSDRWEPDFYIALARAGFISVSTQHADLGSVLLPEMQSAYAVLDWENLHVSRNIRKLIDSGRLEREGIALRFGESPNRVIDRLIAYHSAKTWLCPAYQTLLRALPNAALPDLTAGPAPGFALHAVELVRIEDDLLIAGELGYSVGRTYTSLSGFCNRSDRHWKHFGSLQLVLLARSLEQAGYAFWNLGHPHLRYKQDLGARIVERADFLDRWFEATRQREQ